MKKEFWLIIIMAVVIVVLLAVWALVPASPRQSPTGEGGLRITSLKQNQEISSPLKITGYVTGDGWTGFEGQVGTVSLLDYKGNILAQTYLAATTDWMQLPTNFEANLSFTASNPGPGTLVFKNENASGDPIRDKTFILPVNVKQGAETMTVRVYFGKNEITGSTCSVVFPVDRVVPKTEAVAKAALEELLKGPTDAEKAAGYFTSIPLGSKLNSIVIVDGEARVDFDQTTQSGGGSCSMVERVSEINFTLKQFLTVKSVKLSIDGQTGDIFQP